MVLLHMKDPLELFVKRGEFLPCNWFLPHCDMTSAVESDIKTNQLQLASKESHTVAEEVSIIEILAKDT